MIVRRTFLCGMALATMCVPLAAGAQQSGKIATIGVLRPGSPPDTGVEALLRGLLELGYVEGQNIAIELRYAEGKSGRLAALAAELVQRRVDVLVAMGGTPVALAAKRATTRIPIVMTNVADPVETGLVANLARPSGNITGLATLSPELSGKRLELLKEGVPGLSRVVVLWNPTNPSAALQRKETEAAAGALGLRVQVLEARGPDAFENAFRAARDAGAVLPLGDPAFTTHRAQLTELAARSRLPAMYVSREFVEAGGLMSYGVSLPSLFQRSAYFVDRILKGAKPADLPVEQPTKFELVINQKTAKALGLTIPASVLARADEIIQ